MEIALIGVPLIGGALGLKYPVTRERIYHCIGAWAWACRDAEALKTRRKKHYMSAEVPNA